MELYFSDGRMLPETICMVPVANLPDATPDFMVPVSQKFLWIFPSKISIFLENFVFFLKIH